MERPYGLPHDVTFEDYLKIPVCALSAYNYKVQASIGATTDDIAPALCVFDTGAGPNLIRADLLSENVLRKLDRKRKIVNLRSASTHQIEVLGITSLIVEVNGYRCRQPFVVTRNLTSDVILGTTYIDEHVENLWVRQRRIILRDGTEVPIEKRAATARPLCLRTNESRTVLPQPITQPVKVAGTIRLPPQSETVVLATMRKPGTYVVEPYQRLYDRHKVSMTNAVIETQRDNQPIALRVANFGLESKVLHKSTILGMAFHAPNIAHDVSFKKEEEPVINEVTLTDKPSETDEVKKPNFNFFVECPLKPINGMIPHGFEEEPFHGKPMCFHDALELVEQLTSNEYVPSENLRNQFSLDDLNLSHLTQEHQQVVRDTLRPFAEMWSGHLGSIEKAKHRINLIPGAQPFRQPPYRSGPKSREIEQLEVDRMLKEGVIEPSESEFASPVLLVPKPDGTKRFCVDYRRLNALTVKDSYPLPRMDECLDSLGDAQWFSTLDANSGYWQMAIPPEDKHKTAFVCHSGCFQFRRMPFGLCNAPASFQRAMDIILSAYKWRSCLVYLDDIIIFSSSFKEHLKDVTDILTVLQKAGVSLKLKKCEFFRKHVDYLGHKIHPGKLAVASKTVDAVKGFSEPTTQTQLRSFLGLCNVYRRFVPNFARISAPLNKMLKKDEPAVFPEHFTEEQLKSFLTLKSALTKAPILSLPRKGLPYSIDTDACDYQVGCALMQTHEDGTRHPIGYWSRTLNSAEKNYSVTDKECLAVVWACQLLRPYLEFEDFVIYTDHQALKWLLGATDVSGRLARWRLRLSEFSFSVEYKKGLKNTIADAMSRLATTGLDDTPIDDEIPTFDVNGVEFDNSSEIIDDEDLLDVITSELPDIDVNDVEPMLTALTPEDIVRSQNNDPFCIAQKQRIDRKQRTRFYVDAYGQLTRKSPDNFTQIVVPKELQLKVLQLAHHSRVAGHPGGSRLYSTLRRNFYWRTMSIDCYNTVRSCTKCARDRVRHRQHARFLKLFPPERPLQYVAIDILGPLPMTARKNRYLLVISDRFSKMTQTVPLTKVTGLSVARAFCDKWMFPYGPPEQLLSDRGGQFTGNFFKSLCNIVGIRQAFTSAYHPQTNGQVERFNRTILAGIRAFCSEEGRDWDLYTSALTYGYNSTVHRAIGMTPFELVLSQPPPHLSMSKLPNVDHDDLSPQRVKQRFLNRLKALMQTAKRNLATSQARYKRNFDSKVNPKKLSLRPGIRVFLRREEAVRGEPDNKLKSRALGPFDVVKNLPNNRVVVINRDGVETPVSYDRIVVAPMDKPLNTHPRATRKGDARTGRTDSDGQLIPEQRTLRSSTKVVQNPRSIALPKLRRRKRRNKTRRPIPGRRKSASRPQPESSYTMDRIVQYDAKSNRYKVRWLGFDASDDTWEPAAHLPMDEVNKFRTRRGWHPLPPSVWNL